MSSNRTMHHAHAFPVQPPPIVGNPESISEPPHSIHWIKLFAHCIHGDFTASSNISTNYPRHQSGAALIKPPYDTPNLCQLSNALVKETLTSENIMPGRDDLPVPTTSIRNARLTTVIPLQAVTPDQITLRPPGTASIIYDPHTSQGTKRRLGMGRGVVGYTNKKFKVPT